MKEHSCKGIDDDEDLVIHQIKRGNRFDWILEDIEEPYHPINLVMFFCPYCGVKL